jgi:hypothetical protein
VELGVGEKLRGRVELRGRVVWLERDGHKRSQVSNSLMWFVSLEYSQRTSRRSDR